LDKKNKELGLYCQVALEQDIEGERQKATSRLNPPRNKSPGRRSVCSAATADQKKPQATFSTFGTKSWAGPTRRSRSSSPVSCRKLPQNRHGANRGGKRSPQTAARPQEPHLLPDQRRRSTQARVKVKKDNHFSFRQLASPFDDDACLMSEAAAAGVSSRGETGDSKIGSVGLRER